MKVLNIKTIGYQIPSNAVYIGREMYRCELQRSKWANPFRIGEGCSREASVILYRRYIETRILQDPEIFDIVELYNKDLVCWCAPLSCHGDVLLELIKAQQGVVK